ncbi:hemagglutinin repeat-containing protein [Paraburkholderia sp. C35]|uniref:hemagglutinin repeat-containing protein n=1 Tax=Paraburkholderia sp. C35 TaxID=2126993 RepID=UPI001EF4D329|nr:hemagglutinin repeat-containing protein [Paraburkholderia sp. C35]
MATVNQSMNNASYAGDPRLAALDTAQAGVAVYNAYKGELHGPTDQPLIKATVSIGDRSSYSDSQSSNVAKDGCTSHAGDLKISGHDVVLNASRDINLQSAQDTSQQSGHHSCSGGSIDASFALGGERNGFTIELAASTAKGKTNGNGVTNRDTQINAGNTLTLTSVRDTNLRGAEVAGNTVDANVGRDLNVASQLNTNTYDSKQTSGGFQVSICVPPICYSTTVGGLASVEVI